MKAKVKEQYSSVKVYKHSTHAKHEIVEAKFRKENPTVTLLLTPRQFSIWQDMKIPK